MPHSDNFVCLSVTTVHATRLTATVIIEFLGKNIALHASPRAIRTDQGPRFVSKMLHHF